jgi:DNA repair protein RecO (recombination protein O)
MSSQESDFPRFFKPWPQFSMATYTVHAINLGNFALGETDKVITLFSAERGIVRAVAKGVRKPGAKISGRAEPLNVNKLLLAKGRNLDIITQAESIASFPKLRQNLIRLSYALYYVELTQHFGQGLSEESARYFDFLCQAVNQLAESDDDPTNLCLEFELHLLDLLGYKPQLDVCVGCTEPLTEYKVSLFHHESGGIVCQRCNSGRDQHAVQEHMIFEYGEDAPNNPALTGRRQSPYAGTPSIHITPLVWKRLVLAASGHKQSQPENEVPANIARTNTAARRVVQNYIEHRAGRRMRSLDLVADMN